MSKPKPLTHQEIEQVKDDYMQALWKSAGQAVAEDTLITYAKGWFYIRPAGCKSEWSGMPYRAHQVKNMIAELCKK